MTLAESIKSAGMTENEAMNALQDNGIISDLCVCLADIAPSDEKRAIEFLTNRKNEV